MCEPTRAGKQSGTAVLAHICGTVKQGDPWQPDREGVTQMQGAGTYSQQQIVLSCNEDRASTLRYVTKRCTDVVLAIFFLLVLAPLMLLIAILIRLDTPGPVIFVQPRVGARRRSRNGVTAWEVQDFPFYKFRSMYSNTDQSTHEAYIKAYIEGTAEAHDSTFKLRNDPRVTRVGRVLRKTSLDELPQLFNVIKGDMSLVGPRPVPRYEVAGYQPWHCERLAALPGITGLWQVKGRCVVPFEEQIQMDIDYVRNHSWWLDMKLLLLTIPAILSGRGAG